jgi:hypothetical protein
LAGGIEDKAMENQVTDNGWIKLHRKMLENPICNSQDSYLIQLWLHILLSVNHKEKRFLFNGKEMIVEAGQGIFGLNQITKDLTGIKKDKSKSFSKMKTLYYRKLKILENLGNLKLQPNNKFTLITVINWHKYQNKECSIETQVNLQRNSSETQVKTNKNDKNDKNMLIKLYYNLINGETRPNAKTPTTADKVKCEIKKVILIKEKRV